MRVRSLHVSRFRLITDADLTFGTDLVPIYGANAQGKTTLLEALCVLGSGSSPRSSRDGEWLQFGAHELSVEAEVATNDSSFRTTLHYRQGGRKRRYTETGQLFAIFFAPEHLALVKGSPSERRLFLDVDLGQIWRSYGQCLAHYKRALEQRNALLHEIALRRQDRAVLDTWDHALAESGSRLVRWRQEMVAFLAPASAQAYSRLAGGGQSHLIISYEPSCAATNLEEFETALRRGREDDLRRGMTLLGPHRDDLAICLGERNIRLYGSQGEQRSAALSLKAGAYAFLRKRLGEAPVLLLDDVLSELDMDRRKGLLDLVKDGQTFITSADPDMVRRYPNYLVAEEGRFHWQSAG